MNEKVLIVDDDTELLGLTEIWLRNKGFQPLLAKNGIEGLQMLYTKQPDLVLLDIKMPLADGWEVCRRIRDMCDVPIIMISVNEDQPSLLRGFNLGIDDYVTKPFHFPELVARIESVLRRGTNRRNNVNITFHNEEVDIDWRSRQVLVRGEEVMLSPTEFRLLSCLVENGGWIVTHEDILKKVWGPTYFGDRSYVKLYVRYLRKKIEKDPDKPKWILTERGVGYRFGRRTSASDIPSLEDDGARRN